MVDVIMIEIKTVVVGDTDAGIPTSFTACSITYVSIGKTSLSERFCYGDAPMSAV